MDVDSAKRAEQLMDLVVLLDYRSAFWSSTTNTETMTTMNLDELKKALEGYGIHARFTTFAEIDLTRTWVGTAVIYTSAEDPGLLYKSYIEDCVLALDLLGAKVIPSFSLLRAHHNKVFMEMLRKVLLTGDPLASGTHTYGTLEDFHTQLDSLSAPAFVKKAEGAGSATVRLAEGLPDIRRLARRASRSTGGLIREYAKRALKPLRVNASTHRDKFIVQDAVPALNGDFKVLRYGDHYFAVYRGNRPDDARASGGGRLDFDIESYVEPTELLAYASAIAFQLGSPFLSMDIAHSRGQFYLLEFQAICFGPATLELASRHWFRKPSGQFEEVSGRCKLESIFAEAVGKELVQ